MLILYYTCVRAQIRTAYLPKSVAGQEAGREKGKCFFFSILRAVSAGINYQGSKILDLKIYNSKEIFRNNSEDYHEAMMNVYTNRFFCTTAYKLLTPNKGKGICL